MTIRQLDDAAIMRLKEKARAQRTSVEALARQAIHRAAAALSTDEKFALVRGVYEITDQAKVPGVRQSTSVDLIRESRDFDH